MEKSGFKGLLHGLGKSSSGHWFTGFSNDLRARHQHSHHFIDEETQGRRTMTHLPSYNYQGVNLGPHANLTLSMLHATQMPTQGSQGLFNKSTDPGAGRETLEDQRLVGGSGSQGE